MENTETNRNNEKFHLARKKTMKDKKTNKTPVTQKDMDKNSISIFTSKYSKPIIDSKKNSNEIIINQHIPTSTPFTLEPAKLTCPFCKKDIISEVEESFNCCTCILYCFAITFCAIPCLFCSGLCNSINCYCSNCDLSCRCCCDATHTCPNCKKVVGTHESFPSIC